MEISKITYTVRSGEKNTYLPTTNTEIIEAVFGSQRNQIVAIQPLNELEAKFILFQHRTPNQSDVCDTFQALGQLFSLGVDPVSGLNLLIRRMKNLKMAAVLMDISQSIQQGDPIADAFGKYGELFGETAVHLIRAGAAMGNLGGAFERLADNLTKMRTISRRVQGALVYPVVVLAVVYIVILVFCFAVIPKLTEIYNQFQGNLPWITEQLQNLSYLLIEYPALTLIVPALGFVAFKSKDKIARSPLFNNVLRRMPGIKNFIWKRNLTQVSTTLALLLESGLPLTESLEYSSHVVSDPEMARIFSEIRSRLEEGELVNEAFNHYVEDLGPDGPRLVMAVEVGDATGSLAPLIQKISVSMEEEFDMAAQNLNRTLEPGVIILLASVVGVLVFAIYYPMFTLGQTMMQDTKG